MSFSIVHISDPHFGVVADLDCLVGVERLVPDLEPDLIVVSGDVTLRARHGEYLAARLFFRELQRTAPVFVIPGNHDVQWWRRPFVPFSTQAQYAKYRRHLGPTLTPTMDFPDAMITGVLTSHGVAWGSLTPRLRDIAVKGHLRKQEVDRAEAVFAKATAQQARILVQHHNLLRGNLSKRMGLARWKTAQRRIARMGVDLVLCGHDHQEQVDVLDGVVVSCAGTLSTCSRGGRPSTFHRVCVLDDSIQAERYEWDAGSNFFKRTDVVAFGRRRTVREDAVPARAV